MRPEILRRTLHITGEEQCDKPQMTLQLWMSRTGIADVPPPEMAEPGARFFPHPTTFKMVVFISGGCPGPPPGAGDVIHEQTAENLLWSPADRVEATCSVRRTREL